MKTKPAGTDATFITITIITADCSVFTSVTTVFAAVFSVAAASASRQKKKKKKKNKINKKRRRENEKDQEIPGKIKTVGRVIYKIRR